MSALLHWNTVTPLLHTSLQTLMTEELFSAFRLVGGTSLSLQLGHRISVDIDLFTDAKYESIDFNAINTYLQKTFKYVDIPVSEIIGFGMSYFIGNNEMDSIKLDLYYTDPFIRPTYTIENIRMATLEEIIAMKLDIIQRGGRKKDFWDIHELLSHFSVAQMIDLHEQRYPYSHDHQTIRNNFTNFTNADDDFDPVCLNGKHWELIKLDIFETLQSIDKKDPS